MNLHKKCKAGHFKDNSVVLHGALVCYGGFGQPRCIHLDKCLEDNGFKFSKNGRRIRIKKEAR